MENSIVSFFANKWLIALSVSGLVLLLVLRVFLKQNDCEVKQMYLDLDINNSVDSTWNWGTAPMITLNDQRILNLRKVWSFLDDSASAGDFILKEKGSLQFILEKPNGKTYQGELEFVCDE